ncbi:hypothetical protein N9W34_06795 [Rickettsiales bacterium]|nr:hypothetical protein [Rickettsiales bacterium]
MNRKLFSTILATGTLICSNSFAAGFSPKISADLVVEWQNEYRSNSDNTSIDDTNRSFVRSELAPKVEFTENIFIDGVLVFEPFAQEGFKDAGDDVWFDRHGLFAEEIKLNYENGSYAVWAGKFNPGFGTAWDARGIWGEDFAEDYEITQKIGFGGAYTHETQGMGSHTFAASTFFADTTFLSKGTVSGLDKTKLVDGGSSNTEDFSSFAISVDGENAAGIENLNYHASYRSLAEQDKNQSATTDDESGFAIGLNYSFEANEDLGFDILLEYAGIDNMGGVKNTNHDYYTAGLVTTIKQNWNVTVGYTKRDIDATGTTSDFDDHLFQISGGYDFGNGLTSDIGYRGTDESNQETDIIGFMFRYSKEF